MDQLVVTYDQSIFMFSILEVSNRWLVHKLLLKLHRLLLRTYSSLAWVVAASKMQSAQATLMCGACISGDLPEPPNLGEPSSGTGAQSRSA